MHHRDRTWQPRLPAVVCISVLVIFVGAPYECKHSPTIGNWTDLCRVILLQQFLGRARSRTSSFGRFPSFLCFCVFFFFGFVHDGWQVKCLLRAETRYNCLRYAAWLHLCVKVDVVVRFLDGCVRRWHERLVYGLVWCNEFYEIMIFWGDDVISVSAFPLYDSWRYIGFISV